MDTNTKVQNVRISDIDVGKRMRAVDKRKVKELAENIAQVGLLQPIVVAMRDDEAGKFDLVAGAHRLAAFEQATGRVDIPAVVRKPLSAEEQALIEIDENLMRSELTEAQRAKWLSKRVALWDKLNAESGEEKKAGKKKAEMSVREVAEKTGMSKDKAHRALKRARDLGGDALEHIEKTSLDNGVEMDALAEVKKKAPAKAKEVIEDAKKGKKVSAKAVLRELKKLDKGDDTEGEAADFEEFAYYVTKLFDIVKEATSGKRHPKLHPVRDLLKALHDEVA